MSFKISIVTATYNAESCVSDLLQSVISQKSDDVEFIIIDGASKDKTLEILDKFHKYIDYVISEPDKGIYDAWNKGVEKARGEWIMFLGADDQLMPGAIKCYLDFINSQGGEKALDYISSKAQMIDGENHPIWINGWKWEWPKFLYKMTVAHPGSLHAKKMFLEHGFYDTNYKIVGDYELLLRPRHHLKAAFINMISVKMKEGGMSDSLAAIKEHYKASVKTGRANRFVIYIWCSYVFMKSKLNKLGRQLGLKLNIDK